MIALPSSNWRRYDSLDIQPLAELLLHADRLRLHKQKRGPKAPRRADTLPTIRFGTRSDVLMTLQGRA
ncbi:hypothetical protein AAKU55_003560 [Oxalobacteraceae bacterium GrIS 1.11]